jgi:hypothetical protein
MALRLIHAFQPIIELIQGIAYPLAYITIGTGICLVIIGQKNEGFKLVKWASIGYVAAQLLPGMMKMLYEVGKGLK